ncbi:MAG: UDP-N-acetylmuramate--L-alanine ligase [Bacteroidota bacterium]
MDPRKHYHFIAIGGSVMHNLAIALKQLGHNVTGSDDEIHDPSRSKLLKHNLLPDKEGWFPEKISRNLHAVILGMHARPDNPELLKAKELDIPIYSFPDFIYSHSKDKQRVVVAGSHGKTTITAIIIHVLNFHQRKFDYVIGAQVGNLENTVKLSDAPLIIIEGDEYLASPLDPTPKFLKYQHHIGVISGIAWDHANVFPTEDEYIRQFDVFADATPKGGILVYCETDPVATVLCNKERADVLYVPYKTHAHAVENGREILITTNKERLPINIFGKHNLQNISAAKEVLKKIGITPDQFYKAIPSFMGAAGRLQKIRETHNMVFFKDYAHAPSKVRATTEAVRELYPQRELVACLELHTFSSLSKKFLPQYKNTLKASTQAVVYFNPRKVKDKHLEPFTEGDVKAAFANPHMEVFTDIEKLRGYLQAQSWHNKNLLMMSSGTFNGTDMAALANALNA